MREPTDAQMEGYEYRRAGAAPTASQWDGMAADAARGADGYERRPHLGELAQIKRLRDRLRLAEAVCDLADLHVQGCVAETDLAEALIEWQHAAGIVPKPDGADDYPRAEDMA